ncbi:HAMP domain-containing histidine kinase [Mucilaginibacter sp. HMF5004]|uniref:tetratricopeptide repeat-containing sensor histidine kinase n=1 Tax=Mucilaginibacter rivuli TaxID=2857527 RepID=UPI001C5EDE48|nr:HAMP domain-containing sensor histidine kinase [Mucilaginibacter rivuli]MBW4890015.1 HAMP domain-containing histidine kinase [Mucilaginibacter rivuli]
MYHRPRGFYVVNILKIYIVALVVVLLHSCSGDKNEDANGLKAKIQQCDSLQYAGKGDSAILIAKKMRGSLHTSSPLIVSYYCLLSQYYQDTGNNSQTVAYADSAFLFFSEQSKVEKYPAEYYKALMMKGDVNLSARKFIGALNYYYQAKNIIGIGVCDNGDLFSKLGSIYFKQSNYRLAGRCWAASFAKLDSCHERYTAEKLFLKEQGWLNNAGYAYERAGMLDSAEYYYQLDLKLINKASNSNLFLKRNTDGPKAVLYDNLGGVNLKLGNLKEAEKYLTASIAIPNPNTDGSGIPPQLKLGDLYVALGNDVKAAQAYNNARLLLNRFYRVNFDLETRWNRSYAKFMAHLNKPAEAYLYQSKYISLRDSLERNSTELYKLDVERELATFQQKQALVNLEQKDKVREIYFLGIGIAIILSVIIIVLIARNLNRSKKNQKETTLKNEQLQVTLAELERVNKNYIRIMRVMAHDLRNPLSGMTGIASMLLEDEDFSEDSKHMLKLIETTGTHTMEMINELLKTGLADETEQIVKQNIDLRSLLFDSVELLQFKANEKHQKLIFESDDKVIMANVNHEKIWRVFNNLIVNAIKFSHEGGDIKISITLNNKNILIAIADSGIGIPENEKDSIFEMFTAAKKFGTNGEQPFGLGLSISKKIIEMHRGKIWFKSTVGVGTIFYIELPQVK